MVVVKKYWYIILIIFLVFCTSLGIFFFNKKLTNDKVTTENKVNTSEISNSEEVLIEDNNIDENKVETTENKTEQENTEQENETVEVESQAIDEIDNKSNSTTKNNTKATKQEQPKIESNLVPTECNIQEPQDVVQKPQVQEQQTSQPEQEQIISDKPKENVVEYKENTAMINNIKNAINNNVSEDMQTYGYNVVVDSSIVNLTNQFTFSEKRVTDKIKSKFGTIRIYARDYYLNGSYVWTECYVI